MISTILLTILLILLEISIMYVLLKSNRIVSKQQNKFDNN